MGEEQNTFNSRIEAYNMLLDKLENVVSLLRGEIPIFDLKLESYPVYDERKIIEGYGYLGKVMFTKDGLFEDEETGVMANRGGYTVIFNYFLAKGVPEKQDNQKEKGLEKEIWVLQRASETS
jgi:hypothetical protein|tara:strand:+ start:1964 stop:2329 length:366 start_codon:yes stop_codon:yes gene_type:complete